MKIRIISFVLFAFSAIPILANRPILDTLTIFCKAGEFENEFKKKEKEGYYTYNLKIVGSLNAKDFAFMKRGNYDLYNSLDLSEVRVTGYFGTKGSQGIKRIYYPKNTIPKNIFVWNSLQRLNLPDGIKCIEDGAFTSFSLLRSSSFTLPKSVQEIGKFSFASISCDTIFLPENIKEIGDGAFYVNTVILEKNNKYFKNENECLTNMKGTDLLFFAPKSIKDTIPNGVKCIHSFSIVNYNIPIHIPKTVTKIEYLAFGFSQFNFSIDSKNKYYTSIDSVALLNKKQTKLICYTQSDYSSSDRDDDQFTFFKVPETVTQIEKSAFANVLIDSISLSSNLKEIKERAFNGFKTSTLIIPENCKIVRKAAFKNGQFKKVVFLNSMKNIEDSLFYNSRISSLDFPLGIKKIKSDAFGEVWGLNEIIIPEGVEVIKNNAFIGNRDMEKLFLPNSLKVIGERAFLNSWKLNHVQFPKNLKIIGKEAFLNSCIQEIRIPQEIKRIEEGCFMLRDSCFKIIILPKNIKHIGPFAFNQKKTDTETHIYIYTKKLKNADLVNLLNGFELESYNNIIIHLPVKYPAIYKEIFSNYKLIKIITDI